MRTALSRNGIQWMVWMSDSCFKTTLVEFPIGNKTSHQGSFKIKWEWRQTWRQIWLAVLDVGQEPVLEQCVLVQGSSWSSHNGIFSAECCWWPQQGDSPLLLQTQHPRSDHCSQQAESTFIFSFCFCRQSYNFWITKALTKTQATQYFIHSKWHKCYADSFK